MLRMITYSEAKTILGVGGNQYNNNRDVWKSWVITNGADPTPFQQGEIFQDWAENRLVPAHRLRRNEILITWNANKSGESGGSFANGTTVTVTPLPYGASIQANKPADPTKTGHTFDRWENDVTHNVLGNETVSSPTSYSAIYNAVVYTIVWWNEGRSTKYIIDGTVQYGQTISSPGTPTKPGYTFLGWKNLQTNTNLNSGTDMAGPSLVYTSTGKIEYEAVFTQNTQYTMTWNPNYGSWADADGLNAKLTYEYAGEQITPPSVSLSRSGGWAFDGWYNTTLGRDYQNGDVANGNYTFTAKWIPASEMLAYVFWKVDSNGGGVQHNDGNTYETSNDLLPSDTTYINQRFEPMYRDTNAYGTTPTGEYSYTDTIAHVGGVNVTHEDLVFTATVGTTSQSKGYDLNIIFRTTDTNDSAVTTIVHNSNGTYTDDGGTHKGHGLAVSSTTWDQDLGWKDSIPVTYIASYNGVEVYRKTINILAYSLDAITGIPYWGVEPAVGTTVGQSSSGSWGGSWLYSVHPTTPPHGSS